MVFSGELANPLLLAVNLYFPGVRLSTVKLPSVPLVRDRSMPSCMPCMNTCTPASGCPPGPRVTPLTAGRGPGAGWVKQAGAKSTAASTEEHQILDTHITSTGFVELQFGDDRVCRDDGNVLIQAPRDAFT